MNNHLTSSHCLIDAKTTQKKLGGISKTTLWRLVRKGELNPLKIGRKTVFYLIDIENFINTTRGKSDPQMNDPIGGSNG